MVKFAFGHGSSFLFDRANVSHVSKSAALAQGRSDHRPLKMKSRREIWIREQLLFRRVFDNEQDLGYTIILSDRTFAKENGNHLLGEYLGRDLRDDLLMGFAPLGTSDTVFQ